jgi:release factor glutamine methyltransferase
MTIDEVLRLGHDALAHSPTARLDAELLLAHASALNRTVFRAHGERELSTEIVAAYRRALTRRARGEPIAYILGVKEFWSLNLQITQGVLIPRPETELLVERALKHLPAAMPCDALDIGTGSGAIALALASERPQARIIATDLSPTALECTRVNSAALDLTVQLLQGDLFEPVAGRQFDVIVSNPPYVAPDDPALAADVREYEPAIALYAEDEGLAILQRIAREAPDHLVNGGWLLVEHGWQQAGRMRALLEQHGFSHVRSHADLSGHERVTEAQW